MRFMMSVILCPVTVSVPSSKKMLSIQEVVTGVFILLLETNNTEDFGTESSSNEERINNMTVKEL